MPISSEFSGCKGRQRTHLNNDELAKAAGVVLVSFSSLARALDLVPVARFARASLCSSRTVLAKSAKLVKFALTSDGAASHGIAGCSTGCGHATWAADGRGGHACLRELAQGGAAHLI